ncbi:MAG: excinuclease ABC subunit UvrA [Bacteroidia bacterium]
MDCVIHGAKTHNLKNITVRIPRYKFIVVTGVSGSGKSSLIYDTLYAEGQLRYAQTFSAYTRQFLQTLPRPDVDKIEGLSPVIAMQQHTYNRNPRSTVGTVTDIYDYLRLLFLRVSVPHAPQGHKLTRYTFDDILRHLEEKYEGQTLHIFSPQVQNRKINPVVQLSYWEMRGHTIFRVDEKVYDFTPASVEESDKRTEQLELLRRRSTALEEIARKLYPGVPLTTHQNHSLELWVDTLKVSRGSQRLRESITRALKYASPKDTILILNEKNEPQWFSLQYMDRKTGFSLPPPQPATFSYNTRIGACPACKGLGVVWGFRENVLFPHPDKSLATAPLLIEKDPSFAPWWNSLLRRKRFPREQPWKTLTPQEKEDLLYGNQRYLVESIPTDEGHVDPLQTQSLAGYMYAKYFHNVEDTPTWVKEFLAEVPCPECHGQRLHPHSLLYKIDDLSIADAALMEIRDLISWLESLSTKLTDYEKALGHMLIEEILRRSRFLEEVGLEYVWLFRSLHTLSGGEAQRVRLAGQLGSQLTEVLYILDEPSIGLHPRDNSRLIRALHRLRDQGNTIVVIEHDEETMRCADYLIEIGPDAGRHGGKVVAQGDLPSFLEQPSQTAAYLRGLKQITPPPRRPPSDNCLVLSGAKGRNLKNLTLTLPLGKLIVIAGVSGSGKSSLLLDTLYPAVYNHLHTAHLPTLPYEKIEGLDHLDKVILVDQDPIGRSSRSTPSTYTGIGDLLRQWYSQLPLARQRGYKPGHFSFNTAQGRCPTCKGMGVEKIEMGFLPPVLIPCSTCGQKRYNREVLDVRYKGKSIGDILHMSIEEVVALFDEHPKLRSALQTLIDIGLGYIQLGQGSPTLSGGEAQRIKLATQLIRPDTGHTLYILDEPTPGLHFEDIRRLLVLLQRLVDKGNTVVVIEHNLDVLRAADWVIELGPASGAEGGLIIAQGEVEDFYGIDTPTARALVESDVYGHASKQRIPRS